MEETLEQKLDRMEQKFTAFLVDARKNAQGNKAAGIRARKAWRMFRNVNGNEWARASMDECRRAK